MKRTNRLLVLLALLMLSFTAIPTSTAQDKEAILHYNGSPAWSPDGTEIAFVSGRSGKYDIWVMNADGSNPRNLTSDSPDNYWAPLWAPNGQYISYLSFPQGARFYDPIQSLGYYDVGVMVKDGSNPVNLTENYPGMAGDYHWSPDSLHIALVIGDSERFTSNIWMMEPDGSNPINLTDSSCCAYASVTWSPDAQQLAFTIALIDSLELDGIQLFQIDRRLFSRVTDGRADTEVKWSPTGDVLAVTTLYSDNSGSYDIWRIDVNGENRVNLTPDSPELDWNPIWSPDGKKITFESARGFPNGYGRDIWLMDADGSNLVNLTEDLHTWSIRPSWSPSGQQIAFELVGTGGTVSGLDGESDIWVMDADGSSKKNLTSP